MTKYCPFGMSETTHLPRSCQSRSCMAWDDVLNTCVITEAFKIYTNITLNNKQEQKISQPKFRKIPLKWE